MERIPAGYNLDDDLHKLGKDREQIGNEDLSRLLSGERTGIMLFSTEDTPQARDFFRREDIAYIVDGGKLDFEAKLQLQPVGNIRQDNIEVSNSPENIQALKKNKIGFGESADKARLIGKFSMRDLALAGITVTSPIVGIALMVLVRRNKIKNDRRLTGKEIKALERGETVSRMEKRAGRDERMILQVDREINEVIAVKARDLKIPTHIEGQQLSPIQREQLKNGREITVSHPDGELKAKLDLNDRTGLSVTIGGVTIGETQIADRSGGVERTGGVSVGISDLEKLRRIASGENVDAVLKDLPEEQREHFLREYSLSRSYYNAQDYRESVSDFPEGDILGREKARAMSQQAETLMQRTAYNEMAKMGLVSPVPERRFSNNITQEEFGRLSQELKEAKGHGYSANLSDRDRLSLIASGESVDNVFKNAPDKQAAFVEKYNLSPDRTNDLRSTAGRELEKIDQPQRREKGQNRDIEGTGGERRERSVFDKLGDQLDPEADTNRSFRRRR